jgi:hypothetical protein
MEILVALVNLAVIGFLAWWWWWTDQSSFKKVYWPSLVFKLLTGLLLGYVYSHHYIESDTVRFFESSVELSKLARENPVTYVTYQWSETDAPYSGENRTLFFVKLVSLFALITGDKYWIVSLYFSFVSFMGAWWLTRLISQEFSQVTWVAVFAFLIFPSCVFWSSGVIKETIAVTGLYWLAGLYMQVWLRKKFSGWWWVVALFSLWMLWSLKYYYAALFVPVAVTALLTRWFVENRMRSSARSFYREIVLFVVLLMVMFFVVTFVHPNFYPQRILEVIVENHWVFIQASDPGKVIHFYKLEPTLGSILFNMPWAMLSGLFRPFIWEASNFFQVLVSVENLLLTILVVLSFRHVKKLPQAEHRILIFSLLVYCLLLCALLTLSAPNFGTLVRYRIGFLPFFVLVTGYKSMPVNLLEKLFKG